MKISYQWIKELIPELKVTAVELADRLTHIGLEVEGLVNLADGLSDVVVAEIIEKEKHPDADRLNVCKVSDGQTTYQIVCGAPNVQVGKKYPLALLGAKLPNGIEIKKAKLRGVESCGMLCSSKELGLNEESQGLLTLADDLLLGQPFAEAYGLNDTLLEVGVTPNRGDCLSHLGIAREIAAVYGLSIQAPSTSTPESEDPPIKVMVDPQSGCTRYMSRTISRVKVGDSPAWIKQRLERLGIRPINNIVDATNYIMLETGHALHAFDLHFIAESEIKVKSLSGACDFVTLDGESRKLESGDIIIADAKGPIALAGIMGGQNSGIAPDTTDIVLEAASFDPLLIRKTAKRLGLKTESSFRFERGVPAEGVPKALSQLTNLIVQLAGGMVSKSGDTYISPQKIPTISLTQKKITTYIGQAIPEKTVFKILERLNFKVVKSADGYQVTPPYYRLDVSHDVDLIEEIVRFEGFDKIVSSLPPRMMKPVFEPVSSFKEDIARQFFCDNGFLECIHYSFTSQAELQKAGLQAPETLKLLNPISDELGVMRPSIIPQLLSNYQKNWNPLDSCVRLFELQNIYAEARTQKRHLSGLFAGNLYPKNWEGRLNKMDFAYGKGLLDSFFRKICDLVYVSDAVEPFLHPGKSVKLFVNDQVIGFFGALHPICALQYDIRDEVYVFDLDFDLLASLKSHQNKPFASLSPFPVIARDMALLVNEDLSFEDILGCIKKLQPALLQKVDLFDVYRGDKLPSGKKSMAFSLIYETSDRTLTDDEINKVHFELIEKINQALGTSLRQI